MANLTTKRLLNQLKALYNETLEDIVLLPSDEPTAVNAFIFGPVGTPYENGAFRVRLIYGSDYPAAPPKGSFLTKIFHPNVDQSGDICVNTLKRDWTPDVTIRHILLIIKCLLINPGPDSALNEEAGKLLMESYESFAVKARIYTGVHALKVSVALSEVDREQRNKQLLSYKVSNVLENSNVNKTSVQGGDSGTNKKRKMDITRRTLKRL